MIGKNHSLTNSIENNDALTLIMFYQMSGLLVAIAGFICAVVSVPFGHFKFAHGALGLDIMLIGVFQPINAFL